MFRIIRNFSTPFNPAFLEGKKMGWAEEFARGTPKAFGEGKETTGSFHLIPLTNIPLALPRGATKHAHGSIMAQKAEIVQVMMTPFFTTPKPCKHWPKRASGAFVSSMYS